MLTLVTTNVEGNINAGALPACPIKTARISEPFPRNLPFQDKPAVGYCVFFDPDFGLSTSAQVDVIEKDGGNATVLATVTPSIMAKNHCGSLEMRPFPKLIELRTKRRQSRGMDVAT